MINRGHIRLVGQLLVGWVAFVGFGLIIGWNLHPRIDEVVFVLSLPLFVVPAYAVLCLAAVGLKALVIGLQARARPLPRLDRTNRRIRKNS